MNFMVKTGLLQAKLTGMQKFKTNDQKERFKKHRKEVVGWSDEINSRDKWLSNCCEDKIINWLCVNCKEYCK